MDRYTEDLKRYLHDLAKYHMRMHAGTEDEHEIFQRLDNTVAELLRLGVDEMEIRDIIQRGQMFDLDEPLPAHPTRRYSTPAHRQEIDRIRQMAIYNPDEDDEEDNEDDEPAAAAAAEPFTGEDEDIDSKTLDEYKEMMQCPICKTNIKNVEINPCKHLMCKGCANLYRAQGINKCPVCNGRITNFEKVYLGKYMKYKIKYFQLKNKSFR